MNTCKMVRLSTTVFFTILFVIHAVRGQDDSTTDGTSQITAFTDGPTSTVQPVTITSEPPVTITSQPPVTVPSQPLTMSSNSLPTGFTTIRPIITATTIDINATETGETQNGTTVTSVPPTTESSDTNLGLILGLSLGIGIPVLLIVAGGLIYWFVIRPKQKVAVKNVESNSTVGAVATDIPLAPKPAV